jgi:hypothetical protein
VSHPVPPRSGARRILVVLAAPRPALVSAVARLAERADVEIALPAGARVPAELAGHDNVTLLAGGGPLARDLAGSELVITDGLALQPAAARVGIPVLVAADAEDPLALLRRAERLLDAGEPAAAPVARPRRVLLAA